jgi:hypothetical protein
MVRRALWQAWERDRRGEADLLLCAHVASVAYLGTTDLDRPNPGLDRAMRPMAMTHDAVAAIRQFQVFPYGDKGMPQTLGAPQSS